MMDIINILLSDSFWAASLRIASPLIFGVLGALLCERAGVLNLGIEGIFVAGAMAGWMAVWLGAGLWEACFLQFWRVQHWACYMVYSQFLWGFPSMFQGSE